MERELDPIYEREIFKAAWEDINYETIVAHKNLREGTLRNTASKLWKNLGDVLEERVTRKTLKTVVELAWESTKI